MSRVQLSRCFTLVIAMLAACSAVRAEISLTFCYDPYPPYTLGTGDTPEGGLAIEVLDAVTARIDGVSAKAVLMPWKRCQEEARAGRVDGILPLSKSDERSEYLGFSDGVFREVALFWYLPARYPNGHPWSGDFRDVASLKLAMLNGGHIDDEMQRTFSRVRQIDRADDVRGLFSMLKFGRVDMVAFDGLVGAYHLERFGWAEDVRPLDPPISSQESHFGLSKASGADVHLPAFNAALAELHAAGEIEAIYSGR